MILCPELELALESEAVFYGVPLRRQGEPAHTRRLFKLNGLWFEGEIEVVLEQAGFAGDLAAEFREVKKVKAIHHVMSSDVGQVRLPRPALVLPGRTKTGGFTLEDSIIGQRHLHITNRSGDRRSFTWDVTPLDEGKPWVRPGTTESLAIVEYAGLVKERQSAIEDDFGARLVERRRIQAEIDAARRAEADAKDAATNPLWGSW